MRSGMTLSADVELSQIPFWGLLQNASKSRERLAFRMYDAIFARLVLDRAIPLLTTDAKLCQAVEEGYGQ